MSLELWEAQTAHRWRSTCRIAGMSDRHWKVLLAIVTILSIWIPVLEAASPKNKKEEDSYTIGGVLSGYQSEKHFQETIEVSGTDWL